MKTKYFEAKVKKGLYQGRFKVHVEARGPNGEPAHIFYDNELRPTLEWDSAGESTASRLFATGAQAGRWLERLRIRLIELSAVYEERLRELTDIPV